MTKLEEQEEAVVVAVVVAAAARVSQPGEWAQEGEGCRV